MNWRIEGTHLTGRIVGRSLELDAAGRRCYLLVSKAGNLFLVSGDFLRENE